MRKLTQWNGEYKGINYEIRNFGTESEYNGQNGIWNYYLYLDERQFEDFSDFWLPVGESTVGDRIYYDYESLNFGFHCGITYYEKLGGIDGNSRRVKIGCDYNHLYDEGEQYDETQLEVGAKNSINVLKSMYSDMNVRCGYNGQYYKESEGELSAHGNWWSFEGTKKWEERNV